MIYFFAVHSKNLISNIWIFPWQKEAVIKNAKNAYIVQISPIFQSHCKMRDSLSADFNLNFYVVARHRETQLSFLKLFRLFFASVCPGHVTMTYFWLLGPFELSTNSPQMQNVQHLNFFLHLYFEI